MNGDEKKKRSVGTGVVMGNQGQIKSTQSIPVPVVAQAKDHSNAVYCSQNTDGMFTITLTGLVSGQAIVQNPAASMLNSPSYPRFAASDMHPKTSDKTSTATKELLKLSPKASPNRPTRDSRIAKWKSKSKKGVVSERAILQNPTDSMLNSPSYPALVPSDKYPKPIDKTSTAAKKLLKLAPKASPVQPTKDSWVVNLKSKCKTGVVSDQAILQNPTAPMLKNPSYPALVASDQHPKTSDKTSTAAKKLFNLTPKASPDLPTKDSLIAKWKSKCKTGVVSDQAILQNPTALMLNNRPYLALVASDKYPKPLDKTSTAAKKLFNLAPKTSSGRPIEETEIANRKSKRKKRPVLTSSQGQPSKGKKAKQKAKSTSYPCFKASDTSPKTSAKSSTPAKKLVKLAPKVSTGLPAKDFKIGRWKPKCKKHPASKVAVSVCPKPMFPNMLSVVSSASSVNDNSNNSHQHLTDHNMTSFSPDSNKVEQFLKEQAWQTHSRDGLILKKPSPDDFEVPSKTKQELEIKELPYDPCYVVLERLRIYPRETKVYLNTQFGTYSSFQPCPKRCRERYLKRLCAKKEISCSISFRQNELAKRNCVLDHGYCGKRGNKSYNVVRDKGGFHKAEKSSMNAAGKLFHTLQSRDIGLGNLQVHPTDIMACASMVPLEVTDDVPLPASFVTVTDGKRKRHMIKPIVFTVPFTTISAPSSPYTSALGKAHLLTSDKILTQSVSGFSGSSCSEPELGFAGTDKVNIESVQVSHDLSVHTNTANSKEKHEFGPKQLTNEDVTPDIRSGYPCSNAEEDFSVDHAYTFQSAESTAPKEVVNTEQVLLQVNTDTDTSISSDEVLLLEDIHQKVDATVDGLDDDSRIENASREIDTNVAKSVDLDDDDGPGSASEEMDTNSVQSCNDSDNSNGTGRATQTVNTNVEQSADDSDDDWGMGELEVDPDTDQEEDMDLICPGLPDVSPVKIPQLLPSEEPSNPILFFAPQYNDKIERLKEMLAEQTRQVESLRKINQQDK